MDLRVNSAKDLEMAKLSEAHAEELKESMKAAGINFVVYVPDSWNYLLQKKIIEAKTVFFFGMVREEEATGTAVGAFMGGKKPGVLLEASGVGLSGLALGWLAGLQRMALLIVSSHVAALGEHTDYHAVTRTVTFPILAALNIQSVILDDIKDARRVFKQAQMTVKGQC